MSTGTMTEAAHGLFGTIDALCASPSFQKALGGVPGDHPLVKAKNDLAAMVESVEDRVAAFTVISVPIEPTRAPGTRAISKSEDIGRNDVELKGIEAQLAELPAGELATLLLKFARRN